MSFRTSAGFQAHAKMHGRQQTKPASRYRSYRITFGMYRQTTDTRRTVRHPDAALLSQKLRPASAAAFRPGRTGGHAVPTAPDRTRPFPVSDDPKKQASFILPGTKTNGESRTNRFSPFSMVRSISGPRTNAQRYSFAAFLTYLSSHPKNSRFHSSEFCGLKT